MSDVLAIDFSAAVIDIFYTFIRPSFLRKDICLEKILLFHIYFRQAKPKIEDRANEGRALV